MGLLKLKHQSELITHLCARINRMEEEQSGSSNLPPLDPSKWIGGTTPENPLMNGPAQCTRSRGAMKDKAGSVAEHQEANLEAEQQRPMAEQQEEASQHEEQERDNTSEDDSKKNKFVIITDQESCGTSLFALTERQATEVLQAALGSGFNPSGDWSKAKRTRQLGITCKDHAQFLKANNIQNFKSQTAGIQLSARTPQRKCWGVIRGVHQHVVPDIADLTNKLIGAKIEGLDQDSALETCRSNLTFTRRNTVIKVNDQGKRVYKDNKPVIEETNSVQLCYLGDHLPEELRFRDLGWRKVEPYTFKVQHCWRCLGYTHLGKDCKSITTHCGFCGGPHTTRDCNKKDQVPCCFYCKKDHPVWSMDCPRRRQEQEIAQIRAGTAMTRGMAWNHLKEKQRKNEDQVSRQREIKKQVDRIGNNLNQELAEINQSAIKEMERQSHEVKKLDSQLKHLSNATARDQEKANQVIAALQSDNKELRREMAKLKAEVEGLRTELRRQDQDQANRNFTEYDPMDRFMNREIVFRTDQGQRKQVTPHRGPSFSPKQAQRSSRKDKNQEIRTDSGNVTPRRHTYYSPSRQRRSPAKVRNPQDRVAIDQWEKKYEDQEARHHYGPMKSVSYAAAATTGHRVIRNEQPRARRALVERR